MTRFSRTLRRVAFAGAIASASFTAAPAQAQAPNGYPVTNVNLRAGPGTFYPVIVVVPTHAPISILGCLSDYMWCDVVFQGNRGWMRSIYLQKWYQGYYYALGDWAPRLNINIVNFEIGSYWDAYYRDRPFYAERARWGGSFGEGWTNRGIFYQRLSPYGNWIWLEGQYVWVPANVGPQWRPYTRGRWVFTDEYGWMWVSNEPFGWATYHYGRWGYSNRIGWFWVPGNRWAPAWVSWRESDDYLAWAPLPPTADEGLGINISVGTIPDYYWQGVPAQSFLSVDLSAVIIADRDRFRPILQRTRPIGNVTVVNNTKIVNKVVNITHIERKTNKKVVVHKVAKAKDQKQAGKVQGEAVEVYQPSAQEAPAAGAPPEVKPIEEVAAKSETKAQVKDAEDTEEALVPEDIKKLPGRKKKRAAKAAKEKGVAGIEDTTPPPPPPSGGAPAKEEAAPPPPPVEEESPASGTETPPASSAETPPAPPPAEEATAPINEPVTKQLTPKAKKEKLEKLERQQALQKQKKDKNDKVKAAKPGLPPSPPAQIEVAPAETPPPPEQLPAAEGEGLPPPGASTGPGEGAPAMMQNQGQQGQGGGNQFKPKKKPAGQAATPSGRAAENQGGNKARGADKPCPPGKVRADNGRCVPAPY